MKLTIFIVTILSCSVVHGQSQFATLSDDYVVVGKIKNQGTGAYSTANQQDYIIHALCVRNGNFIANCISMSENSNECELNVFHKDKLFFATTIRLDFESILERKKPRSVGYVRNLSQYKRDDFESTRFGPLFYRYMSALLLYDSTMVANKKTINSLAAARHHGEFGFQGGNGDLIYTFQNGSIEKISKRLKDGWNTIYRFRGPVSLSSLGWEVSIHADSGKQEPSITATTDVADLRVLKNSSSSAWKQYFLGMIPKGTNVVIKHDDPIRYSWNGSDFVKAVDPNHESAVLLAVEESKKQKVDNHRDSGSFFKVIIFTSITGVAIIWLFSTYRKRQSTLVILGIFSLTNPTKAQPVERFSSPDPHFPPYCGIYCVIAAGKLLNESISMESIIDKKYITSVSGSTSSDLQSAISDHNLSFRVLNNLRVDELLAIDGPVILHIRTPGTKSYQHWVLYCGSRTTNDLLIFDPPCRPRTITFAELQSCWNGYAILVTKNSEDRIHYQPPWFEIFFLFAGICTFILASRLNQRSLLNILFVSVVFGGIWHSLRNRGFFVNSDALGIVRVSHLSTDVIRSIDFEHHQDVSDALFVDARPYSYFQMGNIKGSINIPVNSSLIQWIDIQSDIPKNRKLIVYCLNEHCRWSDTVANALIQFGYRNVSIYRGGYSDWLLRNPKVAP